ncbi:MAG: hypothetical protein ACLGI5_19400 [Thermoleophilia bacterium]
MTDRTRRAGDRLPIGAGAEPCGHDLRRDDRDPLSGRLEQLDEPVVAPAQVPAS